MSYLKDFKRMAVGRELPALTEGVEHDDFSRALVNGVRAARGLPATPAAEAAAYQPKVPSERPWGMSLGKRDFRSIMADIEQTTSDISKKKMTVKAGKAKLDALWLEMEGVVGTNESRLAESRLNESVFACKNCGTPAASKAQAEKSACCEEPKIEELWPISKVEVTSAPGRFATNEAHRAALRKAGWVANVDRPEAFKVGDKVLLSLANGYEEWTTIKGFYKGGGARLATSSGGTRRAGELAWKKASDIKESRLAEAEDADIAMTIVQQMGGRMKAMLGATLTAVPKGLKIKWPQKQRSLGNVCVVTLRPDDTYDMEFFNGAKSVKKFGGLYAEDLKPTFEKHTGWYLTL
jgi:hypothetical protein